MNSQGEVKISESCYTLPIPWQFLATCHWLLHCSAPTTAAHLGRRLCHRLRAPIHTTPPPRLSHPVLSGASDRIPAVHPSPAAANADASSGPPSVGRRCYTLSPPSFAVASRAKLLGPAQPQCLTLEASITAALRESSPGRALVAIAERRLDRFAPLKKPVAYCRAARPEVSRPSIRQTTTPSLPLVRFISPSTTSVAPSTTPCPSSLLPLFRVSSISPPSPLSDLSSNLSTKTKS